jgi:tetratricopeptide (TPR) repeat protein
VGSIGELESKVQARPRDPAAWLALARALAASGEIDRARESLQRALAIEGLGTRMLIEIGELAERIGERGQAVKAFRIAVGLDRTCREAHQRLAAVLMRSGDSAAAALALRVAVTALPDDAALHVLLARALTATGRLGDAEKHARRALSLEPKQTEAQQLLTDVELESKILLSTQLAAAGKTDQRSALLRTIAAQGGLSAELEVKLGTAMSEAGLRWEALQHFKQAIRLKPNLVDAHLALGRALEAEGALEDAVAAFKSAILLAPSSPSGHYDLGMALRRLGDTVSAAHELAKALALNPNDRKAEEALSALGSAGTSPYATFGGDLAIVALPEMLEFLAYQRATGIIEITSDHGTGIIELVRGSVLRVARRSPQDSDVSGSEASDTEARRNASIAALGELVSWRKGHAAFRPIPPRDVDDDALFETRWLLLETLRHLDERGSK